MSVNYGKEKTEKTKDELVPNNCSSQSNTELIEFINAISSAFLRFIDQNEGSHLSEAEKAVFISLGYDPSIESLQRDTKDDVGHSDDDNDDDYDVEHHNNNNHKSNKQYQSYVSDVNHFRISHIMRKREAIRTLRIKNVINSMETNHPEYEQSQILNALITKANDLYLPIPIIQKQSIENEGEEDNDKMITNECKDIIENVPNTRNVKDMNSIPNNKISISNHKMTNNTRSLNDNNNHRNCLNIHKLDDLKQTASESMKHFHTKHPIACTNNHNNTMDNRLIQTNHANSEKQRGVNDIDAIAEAERNEEWDLNAIYENPLLNLKLRISHTMPSYSKHHYSSHKHSNTYVSDPVLAKKLKKNKARKKRKFGAMSEDGVIVAGTHTHLPPVKKRNKKMLTRYVRSTNKTHFKHHHQAHLMSRRRDIDTLNESSNLNDDIDDNSEDDDYDDIDVNPNNHSQQQRSTIHSE